MATRATIAVQNANGSYSAIYSHWDGYVNHLGRVLYNHYQDANKVAVLVEGGDISSLATNGEPVHYENTSCEVLDNYMDLMLHAKNTGTEFLYVFSDGYWEYVSLYGENQLRKSLGAEFNQ